MRTRKAMHSGLSSQGFSLSAEQRRALHIDSALEQLPPPPKFLFSADAKQHWVEVGAGLVEAGLLTKATLPIFAEMCDLWGEMMARRAKKQPILSGERSRMREYRKDLRIMDMLHGYPATAGGEAPPITGPVEFAPQGPRVDHRRSKHRRRAREEASRQAEAPATNGVIAGGTFDRFTGSGRRGPT